MSLAIAQLGQPILRQVAAEVDPAEISSPAFTTLIRNMRETLVLAGGVGLAGPQVFVGKRVFLAAVGSIPKDAPPEVDVFINPRLTGISNERSAAWEGCLSFAELLVLVNRPRAVRLSYLNERGEACLIELQGFPARVVQHELDHLDGILTLDRAASTRDIIKESEIEAVQEEQEENEE